VEQLINTFSPDETYRIGEYLGRQLKGGEVICLFGELGAGKTVFAKGLARGLEILEEITSPTFTLIQEYLNQDNSISFIHMDLYRLQYPEEVEVIGATDYFRADCVCLIEWPEIIEDYLPEDILEIRIKGSGELPRSIQLGYNKKWQRIIESIPKMK
jgi:tRNA threonylcarbamoyladenosine biosynthesis protein TsaE